MKKVAIIEDDKDISDLLELHLNDLQCECFRFIDGGSGLEFILQNKMDLIILDINLPVMDGLEVCQLYREKGHSSPILMLTARSQEIDKVIGLDMGADDYITKPFGIREFIARVKVIFRRTESESVEKVETILQYKAMTIDRSRRVVILNDERLELTPKEFDLLYLLASNPGTTYDRKKLLNLVWGYDFDGYEHTVNTHINRLRIKIEKDLNKPEYVLTTWGVGYRFNDQPE